ncbi:MAG: OmpA family protein [Bacteroidia bacterium]|nr:OmpA family protein [Bacteroidia bacterium]MDW8157321.1 OmpA family protein [Bacteroidia bacterium]
MKKLLLISFILIAHFLLLELVKIRAWAQPILENLGPNVNSTADELSPIISADGKTLFFVRNNHPDNVGGIIPGKNNMDIWFSRLQPDGTWGKAENLTLLNDEHNNVITSASADGNLLLLGDKVSRRTRTGWSAPEKLNIRNFRNVSKYSGYFLSNNGKVLILSIENEKSILDQDLFVSFLQPDGSWSEPANLGKTVNTEGKDYSPFLAADGRTLYYCTDGHIKNRIGGVDLYVTRRLDDSWRNWSTPENLGPTVNTPGTDAYFVIPACGDWAYVVSTNNSLGAGDIFRLPIPAGMKPNPVMIFSGVVKDDRGQELDAEINYREYPMGREDGRAYTNPATGDFTIVLPVGKKYIVQTTMPGYTRDSLIIDLTNVNECQTKSHSFVIKLKPTIVSGRIYNELTQQGILANLSYRLPDGSENRAEVNNNGEYRFEVPGTVDNFNITINAEGFVEVKEAIRLSAEQKNNFYKRDFALKSSDIELIGKVLNAETQAPIAATITYKKIGESIAKEGKSSTNGDYKLKVKAETAEYELTATAIGFYPNTEKISIAPGQTTFTKDIKLLPKPPLLLFGKVLNDKTGEGIDARIMWERAGGEKQKGVMNSAVSSGEYKLGLPAVDDYNLIVKKDKFITEYINVSVPDKGTMYQEIQKDIRLIPIEIGTTVRLNNIQFEFNKATLRPESFVELDRLVSLMNDASTLVIEIAGHTDNVGSPEYNLKLSRERAAAVRDYLLSKGISPDRVRAEGYGETKPLVDNKTEANRAINRRVEFRVISM